MFFISIFLIQEREKSEQIPTFGISTRSIDAPGRQELHRLAARLMRREKPGHTLQTTGLVHETYFKLIDQKNVRWQNRAHFFAIAAQLMRRILLAHAKSQARAKRGGGVQSVRLDAEMLPLKERRADLIDLDEALPQLAEYDAARAGSE